MTVYVTRSIGNVGKRGSDGQGNIQMAALMRSVFQELRMQQFEHPLSSETAYRMTFGPYQIEAVVLMNRYFRQAFFLSGIVNTGRTMRLIESELPLEVDSREQGLAMLAHHLREAIPEHLKPDWLREGEGMRKHLPWEKERAAYRRRPLCNVDREWMRIACRKLREHSSGAVEDDSTTFYFDGAVLNICAHAAESVPNKLDLAMRAEGRAWSEGTAISTWRLESLPRRLMTPMVQLCVWQGSLIIANHRFPAHQILPREGTLETAQATSPDIQTPGDAEAASLSFFEIEGRPVAKGVSDGRRFAFVFSDAAGWGAAPGLVSKAGPSFSQADLAKKFPRASCAINDLNELASSPPETALAVKEMGLLDTDQPEANTASTSFRRENVVLYENRNEGGKTTVTLEWKPDGSLQLFYYDIGPASKAMWGDSDYENWITIPAEALPQLAFWLLADKYKERYDSVSSLEEFCKEKSIEHTQMSWT